MAVSVACVGPTSPVSSALGNFLRWRASMGVGAQGLEDLNVWLL